MTDSVDLVYTWVDGGQLSHLLTRTCYRLKETVAPDNTWVRWADREELRYSMRSVERNANFFRKIFIICMDGQRPKWLKDSERVTVVSHSEFIPKKYLPTFCSTVIESYIHKIPGLGEKFVYSNDDFIFLREVSRETFFKGEKPVIYLGELNSAQGKATRDDEGHVAGMKNANELLNKAFGPVARRQIYHFPQALTKTGCERVWAQFSNELLAASESRFRSATNIAFTNCLAPNFMLHTAMAERSPEGGIGIAIGFRNVRAANLLVSLLKHKAALPETRARAKIEQSPQSRLLVIVADRTTIKKVLDPFFPEPSSVEL